MTISALAPIVLDLLLLAALGGTIYYAAILSRALSALRGSRGEFAQRVEALTDAISRANATIADLREAGDTASVELKGRVEAARALNRELKEVTAAAEALAGRLETLSARGRRAVAPDPSPPVERARPPAPAVPSFAIRDPEFDGAQIHSRAERELLAALRGARASQGGR